VRSSNIARVSRAYAYAVGALMISAVLSPALLDPHAPGTDSFPLSTYPMFARDKPRTATVTSALALGPAGFEQPLAPSFVGTQETMQALRTIALSVQAGPERAAELCAAIAERVARSDARDLARADQVALVAVTVDSIRYFQGDRTPLRRKVHERCPVPRSAR
jgi:hypothetical protein